MKINIACPSYRAMLHPRAKMAMDAMMSYSRCSCFENSQGLAEQLFDAAAAGKRLKLPKTNPFHHPSQCPLGKHDIQVIPQPNGSIIHWSRNDLLTRRQLDADYVLFCDDDIVITYDTLERMLAHGKDIVAGLCTKRVDPPEPNFRDWMEEVQNFGVILEWANHGKLREVGAVGTGLMLLSRRVIEDVANAYYPQLYKDSGNGFWFEFIRGPHGLEWGEDLSFCFKAARIGYKIYVDTAVLPEHMGDYGYKIDDYLDYQQAVIAAGGIEQYRTKIVKQQVAKWEEDTGQAKLPESLAREPEAEPVGVR